MGSYSDQICESGRMAVCCFGPRMNEVFKMGASGLVDSGKDTEMMASPIGRLYGSRSVC